MPLRLGYMSPSEQQMGDVSVQGSSGHDVIVTASMCSGSDFPVPSASPPAARQGSSRESCARPSAALLEIEQHVDVGGLRRMPAWGAFCNNVAFMAVPRSIPACFKATGWSLGIASLTYSTVVTFDTGVVLGDLCLQEPALTSFPLLAGEAMARVSSEANAPRARAFGYLSVQGLQFSTYYLTAVAELIYFEQYFGQLFDSSALCQWQWLLLVGVICVPVMQVPSFHETRWAAVLLGLLPLAFNVCVFFVEVAAVRPWDCVPGPSFEQPGGRSVFLGFSAFAYAFGGHGLYPEEVREMKRPSSWRAVIAATYAVTVPMYWACGLVGYAAYGDYAQANINLNFPPNTLNRVSIGVQLAQEVFFVLESNLVLVLAIELSLGVDPSRACSPPVRGVPPWLARLGLRTLFLSTQVFIAQLLLAGQGDTLLALQALTGAVGMAAFTYFLPYMLLVALSREPLSRGRKAWCAANILIGVVLSLAGVWSSVGDLVDASSGVFAGACKLPYLYAPSSEDDPCFVSGLPPFRNRTGER